MKIKLDYINLLCIDNPINILKKINHSFKDKKKNQIILLDALLFSKCMFDKKLRNVVNSAFLVLPKGLLFTCGLKIIFLFLNRLSFKQKNKINSSEKYFLEEYPEELWIKNLKTSDKIKIIDYSNLPMILLKYFSIKEKKFFFINNSTKNMYFSAKHLKQAFPKIFILGSHSCQQFKKNPTVLIKKIQKTNPEILIVDMQHGKQDKWIFNNLNNFKPILCVGVNNFIKMLSGKNNTYQKIKNNFKIHKWINVIYFFLFIIIIFLYSSFYKNRIHHVQ